MFVLTDDDTLQVRLQEQMKIEDSEVDDEFLTFLKTSLTHRLKWQQVKKEKKEEEEETFSDFEKRVGILFIVILIIWKDDILVYTK